MKNLQAIEQLEDKLAHSPVRINPALGSPRKDRTHVIPALASMNSARGNPALCSVKDNHSASNTDEVFCELSQARAEPYY